MNLDNYPGAKSGSGITQWLINQIPLHERYFELFAGSAQLFRAKKKAKFSMLADIDEDVFEALLSLETYPCCIVTNTSWEAFFLSQHRNLSKKDFIYLDPPYPKTARRSGKAYYKHEMLEDAEHEKLLTAIQYCKANVMISTRQNDLYDIMLKDWRKEKFQTMDRGGICEEIVYMNYEVPALLHQYDYLGNGFTDRQRISRKIKRFSNKIAMLPGYERHLFIQEMIKQDSAAVHHFLTMIKHEK